MSFSKRMGYEPSEPPLQLESMNDALRTAIWNCLYAVLVRPYTGNAYVSNAEHDALDWFARRLWMHHLGLPLDDLPTLRDAASAMKEVVFSGLWREVYDLIEFVHLNGPSGPGIDLRGELSALLNSMLERENAGYRVVEGVVVPITSEEELEAISEAATTSLSTTQRRHLRAAIEMLRDRENPDYRNSIKESVSAVEAACRAVTGNPRATLSDALKLLQRHQPDLLHPALRDGLMKIYGYTSDDKGIRHALLDDQADPSFPEAKFMLVACSAFVNLLAELPAPSATDD